jgi:hypothetical protein
VAEDGFGGQIEAAVNQLQMLGKNIVAAMPEAVRIGGCRVHRAGPLPRTWLA